MSRKSKKTKKQQSNTALLPVADQQQLSAKLQNTFDKQVLSEYESDNYRECIKQCDRILHSYPEHGETLAMKGLCLHCQGCIKPEDRDKDESLDVLSEEETEILLCRGRELINTGLRNNLKSSICWRVKGLSHKAEHEYERAIKCYKHAALYDSKNQRILTDLSSLLIEQKRFGAFLEVRNELWLLNQDKWNCVALCVALYLNGDYAKCTQFIEDNIVQNNGTSHKFEMTDKVELNEVYLLRARLLFAQHKFAECVSFIDKHLQSQIIVDSLQALQLKLNACQELKLHDESVQVVRHLIDINPDNLTFHEKYVSLLSSSSSSNIVDSYKVMQDEYKRCDVVKRMLLLHCPSDASEFKPLMHAYLTRKLSKSVLSLYNDICELYNDAAKARIMDDLLVEYRSELESHQRFTKQDAVRSASPMCLVWVNYFYCCRLIALDRLQEALSVLNSMIARVPTCIDLFVLKAKLYKYSGNADAALLYLDHARCLDKADRYLNTKCVRYALRALQMDKADSIIALFLKKTEGTQSLQNLQVMWYQLHRAEAHEALQQYGPALKQYDNVYQHFATFWANQSDFHRYSYRKCAIASYLHLLEWEYNLRNHPFFLRAARRAVFLWFKLWRANANEEKTNAEQLFGKACWQHSAADKKQRRQYDERGWDLIHSHKPLDKVKAWLVHLLPLVSEQDATLSMFICVTHIIYLLYTGDTQRTSNKLREIIQPDGQHHAFFTKGYFVYHVYVYVLPHCDRTQQSELTKLITTFDDKFLLHYLQQNLKNHCFENVIYVVRTLLECKEIQTLINMSLTDIISQIVSFECDARQCLQLRTLLQQHDKQDVLGLFDEQYVKIKYPLQLEQVELQ